ncbi:MAG: hypothetical protein SGBAC_004798 [Bacillariaceae sp.]
MSYQVNLPASSFSTKSPSSANIGRYRANSSHHGFQSKHHEPTRDYDLNVTQLYELLESSQWEAAMNRCVTFPEEVRTWIVRKDLNGKLRWRVLPLHSSIIFKAPKATIQHILSMHILAASKQDDQGMLPLHLAFRHKLDEDVLQQLLEAFPNGMNQKDRRGRIPIDHANEVSFSGRFVQLYALAASSQDRGFDISEERDATNDAKAASIEMYEERMKDMSSHYEARNCGSRNSRSSQLEAEVQLLQSSLERANAESRDMVQVLKKSRENEKHFENKCQVVLNNQQALHKLCMKQQHQLEQAQRIRAQMLRSMLNSEEDRGALIVASEISQMSSNLVVATDDILSHTASKMKKEGQKGNPIALVEPEETMTSRFQQNNNYWTRSIAEHGDEISGITEVSPF